MHTLKKNRSVPETVWIISIALLFIFDIDLSYPYIKSFRSYPAFIGFQIRAFLTLVADCLKLNFRSSLPVAETFLCIFDLDNMPHIWLNKIIEVAGDVNKNVNYLYLYVRALYWTLYYPKPGLLCGTVLVIVISYLL